MPDITKIFSGLPVALCDPLVKSYQEIASNYAEHRWEPSELNGGKFCEIVYTIIHGQLSGKFLGKPTKPNNMVDACRALESISNNAGGVGDRSLRILIPRTLLVLYEIRNNRGVGHAGGDVDPNFLDATAVYSMASWILAEMIRIFHKVSTIEAREIVDMLIERKYSLIWEIQDIGIKRVLDPKMEKGDQVLLLLHSRPSWVAQKDLIQWVEYSTANNFKKRILLPFHKARLIEYDELGARARISPAGSRKVEEEILKFGTHT